MATGTSLLIGHRVPEQRNRFKFFTVDRRNFVVLPGIRDADGSLYSNLLHEPIVFTKHLSSEEVERRWGASITTPGAEGIPVNFLHFATYEEKKDGDKRIMTARYFLYIFSDSVKADTYLEYTELKDPYVVVKSTFYDSEDSPYGIGRGEEFLSEAEFLNKLDRLVIKTAQQQARPTVLAAKGQLSDDIEQENSIVKTWDPELGGGRPPVVIQSKDAGPLGAILHERQARLTNAEGTDLPTTQEQARFMTATEWSDRRATANQILSQTIQIVIQNVFYPSRSPNPSSTPN